MTCVWLPETPEALGEKRGRGRTWSQVCLIRKSACLVATLLQLCLPLEARNNPSPDGHVPTGQVSNQAYFGQEEQHEQKLKDDSWESLRTSLAGA